MYLYSFNTKQVQLLAFTQCQAAVSIPKFELVELTHELLLNSFDIMTHICEWIHYN